MFINQMKRKSNKGFRLPPSLHNIKYSRNNFIFLQRSRIATTLLQLALCSPARPPHHQDPPSLSRVPHQLSMRKSSNLVTFYPNLLLQRRTKLMVWNYIFNGGIYEWQVISNSEFCKNCKYLFSHFRQSLLPPPATCISLDHSQSRYIYVIFSSVIEHVISTGYLLTWSITPNIQPLFWRAWTRIIASARSRYLYVTYSYVIRHHLQNVIASVMVAVWHRDHFSPLPVE